MEIFFLISGIVLILMFLVLLILSPAALIGILAGVLIIIFRKKLVAYCISSSKVSKEIRKEQQEKLRTKREAKISVESIVRKFNLVERIPVSGITPKDLKPFWSYEEKMCRDLAWLYERGERIFRDNYSFKDAAVELSGSDVLVNGQPFGHLSPNAFEKYQDYVSKYPDSYLSIDAEYGYYAKIVRNPDYDKDFDDEDEKNMVEYDSLDTPRATLSIHYTTERSFS